MPSKVHPASKLAVRFLELVCDPHMPRVTVLMGGGSIIKALTPAFQQMAELDRTWENVTIGLTDERYSETTDYPEANFTKLNAVPAIFQLHEQGLELVPILAKGASLESDSVKFNDFLTQTVAGNSGHFVGIVGVGSDFHMAGIVPHKPEYGYLFREQLAVGYDTEQVALAANPYSQRITVTFAGLEKLNQCWVYATHKSKLPVLQAITAAKQPPPIYNAKPAVFLWELPEVSVFTDLV